MTTSIPCSNAELMGKHACTNQSQCWEPCGALGHSAEHARVSRRTTPMPELKTVIAFLQGEGELDGVNFGDKHPTERGAFWWRKYLSAAIEASQPEQGRLPNPVSRDEVLAGLRIMVHDGDVFTRTEMRSMGEALEQFQQSRVAQPAMPVQSDDEIRHWAEEYECAMKCLDDAGAPMSDSAGAVYSLWGRIKAFSIAQPAVQPAEPRGAFSLDFAKAKAAEWHGQAGGELLPQLTTNELAGILTEVCNQSAEPLTEEQHHLLFGKAIDARDSVNDSGYLRYGRLIEAAHNIKPKEA